MRYDTANLSRSEFRVETGNGAAHVGIAPVPDKVDFET